MKAITLWQPWAELVALGVKHIETRSWPAPPAIIGQRIAIHAAAKRPPAWGGPTVGEYRFRLFGSTGVALEGPGLPEFQSTPRLAAHLPSFGAVVASATLHDCVPMDAISWWDGENHWPQRQETVPPWHPFGERIPQNLPGHRPRADVYMVTEGQRPYGDFSPGRYAWLLDDILAVWSGCPARCDAGYFHVVRGDALGGRAGKQPCLVCHGAGSCRPIPAKGGQRVWNWTP